MRAIDQVLARSTIRAAQNSFDSLREDYYERLNSARVRLTTLSARLACADDNATPAFDDIREFAHRLRSEAALFENFEVGHSSEALERAAINACHSRANNAVAAVWGPLERLAKQLDMTCASRAL